jgi:hypothetical protein
LTFFHPDYTVGSGVSPDHAQAFFDAIDRKAYAALVGCTTGGELRSKLSLPVHPAPKVIYRELTQ